MEFRRFVGVGLTGLVAAALAASMSTAAASRDAFADGSRAAAEPALSRSSANPDSRCEQSGPPGADWTLRWQDEFDGTELDLDNWNRTMDFPGRAGGRHHNDAYGSYVLDENTVISDGVLSLITDEGPVVGDDPEGVFDYSQGFISSHDLFFHSYGYWEICAKFPAGKGLWPAFWLIPQDRSWPPEFDIAEWFAGFEDPAGTGGMHQGMATGPDYTDVTWDGAWRFGPEPTTSWHSWALEWEPGRAVFYRDGQPIHEIVNDRVPDKPMYIVLNSGTCTTAHASRGCPPDADTVFPNAFEVEHVRVYDRDVCDTTIAGDRHQPIVIGSGVTCIENATIASPVRIEDDARVFIRDSTIYGQIHAENAASVSICESVVNGTVSVAGTTGGIVVGGDAAVNCGPNTIRGTVEVIDNSTTGAPLIAGNTILGPLSCAENVPAPTSGGQANSGHGPRTGQCADL